MAKVTLIGFNNWTEGKMWDGLKIPQEADKSTLVNYILTEYGEQEPLYDNPDILALQISLFSKIHEYTMQELWDTTKYEYDPIYNYDRHETETETPDITWTKNGTSSDTRNENGTNTGTVKNETETSVTSNTNESNNNTRNETGSNNNEHTVSGFDSNSYVNSYKDNAGNTNKITDNGGTEGKATSEAGGSETRTDNLSSSNKITANGTSNTTEKETGTRTYERRAYGNIGVTTTQQMIESQREIVKFSWYQAVGQMFCNELLLSVY